MPEDRVNIKQVYDMMVEVRDQLKKLNGTVQKNCIDIAVLQEQQHGNRSSWDRVWGVLQPVIVALITAAVVVRAVP